MKSNIKLKVAFCNLSNKKFAIVSSDPTYFHDYMNGMSRSLENIDHNITIEEIVIQTGKHKAVHKALEVLDVSETILTAENVYSVEQLHTWLAIKAGTYEAKEEWDSFLQTNDLLNEWIDGDIKLITAHTYSERSKEFGYKNDIKKIESNIHTYEEIWNLPELFKGNTKTTHGTYAKYSYTTDNQIIEMTADGRCVKLNQEWLEKKDPAPVEYRLADLYQMRR